MQWIAAAISFIGVYLNIAKNKWCFVIWMFGNGIWIYINFTSELPAQAITFIGYSLCNVYGFYKWTK